LRRLTANAASTLDLWLDMSIFDPAARHRPNGCCPLFSSAWLSLAPLREVLAQGLSGSKRQESTKCVTYSVVVEGREVLSLSRLSIALHLMSKKGRFG